MDAAALVENPSGVEILKGNGEASMIKPGSDQ
jgi:hypothetical protein